MVTNRQKVNVSPTEFKKLEDLICPMKLFAGSTVYSFKTTNSKKFTPLRKGRSNMKKGIFFIGLFAFLLDISFILPDQPVKATKSTEVFRSGPNTRKQLPSPWMTDPTEKQRTKFSPS